MDCGDCGAPNEADSLFCESCGAGLERSCGGCGATSKPTAQFCRKCGQRFDAAEQAAHAAAAPSDLASHIDRDPRSYTPRHLAQKILGSKAALEGERKQVTVLFADVKSSMEIAEQLDPEEWHEILNRFFEILTEGVHRFEGNVNQYTGDGIMALFGAPIAHEDHANRACYTALYLRDTLTTYTDQLRIERGLSISVRIGINSGEVVVGKIGDDLRMDYTAQGHTVGLAQRMESLAEGGKALIAAETIERVEGFFTLRDLGEMQVKGVAQPVRVAELEGVGAMRTRLDRSRARGLSKFVGRDEDMQRLEAALDRALDGDGQVVGVVADAGTGKSRLCFEFVERCRARNITVRTSTGVPHGHAVPLQPILEFYREIFGVAPGDSDADARQKIAGSIAQTSPEELDSLPLLFDFMRVPDPAQPSPNLSEEQRERELMGLIRRLTAGRSRREPAVLMFEDLHWLDPQTETIIEHLVDASASTRTLFLVNFRPEFRADWMSRSHYQQVALRPLDANAAADLLAEWLGPDESLRGFAQEVCERTGGNPFFMEEVVQGQIESGALVGSRGAFRLVRSVDSHDVPPSVQALLAARIDRLNEETKMLLQTAAVIGDETTDQLLGEVAEVDPDVLADQLRQLVQGEFLFEASLYPERGYAFKHPLTREVAYGSLLTERRRGIHASVATKLQKRAGNAADAQAALLAHHWEQAGHPLEAARWQTVAGDRQGASHSEETLFHLGKVIELLADSKDSPAARELRGKARARLVYSASRSARPPEEVTRLFDEAQRDLGDSDSRDLAVAQVFYGIARNGTGQSAEGQSLCRSAIEMARRLGDADLLAFVLGNACIVFSSWTNPQQLCDFAEELERLCVDRPGLGAEFTGARPLAIARIQMSFGLAPLGRGDESGPLIRKLGEMVATSDNPMERGLNGWAATNYLLSIGDTTGALESSREGLTWTMQSTNESLRGVGHWSRGTALLRAGRLDEAFEQLNRARETNVIRALNRGAAFSLYPSLCELELERGDPDAARRFAEEGLEIVRPLDLPGGEATMLAQIALARIAGGEIDEQTEATLKRAAELVTTQRNRATPYIARARAMLARSRGDEDGYVRGMREASAAYRSVHQIWRADQIDTELESSRG